LIWVNLRAMRKIQKVTSSPKAHVLLPFTHRSHNNDLCNIHRRSAVLWIWESSCTGGNHQSLGNVCVANLPWHWQTLLKIQLNVCRSPTSQVQANIDVCFQALEDFAGSARLYLLIDNVLLNYVVVSPFLKERQVSRYVWCRHYLSYYNQAGTTVTNSSKVLLPCSFPR
jgi:hypothetical protein